MVFKARPLDGFNMSLISKRLTNLVGFWIGEGIARANLRQDYGVDSQRKSGGCELNELLRFFLK